jgi:hypothetical protein
VARNVQQTREQVYEILTFLSNTIERIQLNENFLEVLTTEQRDDIYCAAAQLQAAVMSCLAAVIHRTINQGIIPSLFSVILSHGSTRSRS